MDQIDDFFHPILNELEILVPSHTMLEFVISSGYINFDVKLILCRSLILTFCFLATSDNG